MTKEHRIGLTEKDLNGDSAWNGAALRKSRKDAYVTQQELADRARVSKSLVRDVERGAIKFSENAGESLWQAMHALSAEFYKRNPQLQTAGKSIAELSFSILERCTPSPEMYIKGDQIQLEEQQDEIEKLRTLSAEILEKVGAQQAQLDAYKASFTAQQARLAGMEAEIADYQKLFAKMSEALGTRQDFEDFLEQFVQRRLKEGQ